MKRLVFLTMLFGLMIFVNGSISAQNVCSKNSDGKQIYVEIANMTNTTFTVNLVDEKCKEISSDQQVPAMEMFSRILTDGQAFRVREVGTKKLLHQFVVNPEKPLMFIETDSDNSKISVRDFDVISDDDFQKRADAAFAAIKSETGDAAATNSNLDKFKKHLIGTWKSKIGEAVRYDRNTLTSFDRRGSEGVTRPYRFIDEKTIETAITDDFRFASRSTITFKDNYQTMIEYNSILKETTEYRRVK